MKQCLQSVNHEQFSHSNGTGQQAQKVAGNPRFSTETPLENADKNSSLAEKTTTARSREQSTEEHRLAQRRQRRHHSDHKHVQKQQQNTTITLQMEPM